MAVKGNKTKQKDENTTPSKQNLISEYMWEFTGAGNLNFGNEFSIQHVRALDLSGKASLVEDLLRAASFVEMLAAYECYGTELGPFFETKAKMRQA